MPNQVISKATDNGRKLFKDCYAALYAYFEHTSKINGDAWAMESSKIVKGTEFLHEPSDKIDDYISNLFAHVLSVVEMITVGNTRGKINIDDRQWFNKVLRKLLNWDKKCLESLKETVPLDITESDLERFFSIALEVFYLRKTSRIFQYEQYWEIVESETHAVERNPFHPCVNIFISQERLPAYITELMSKNSSITIDVDNGDDDDFNIVLSRQGPKYQDEITLSDLSSILDEKGFIAQERLSLEECIQYLKEKIYPHSEQFKAISVRRGKYSKLPLIDQQDAQYYIEKYGSRHVPKDVIQDNAWAIIYASYLSDIHNLQYFLQIGFDPDGQVDGQTPLGAAVYVDNVEAARELIKAGANVNKRIKPFMSPLEEAAFVGATRVVKLLLEHGAELGLSIQCAADRKHYDICQILLDHREKNPSSTEEKAVLELPPLKVRGSERSIPNAPRFGISKKLKRFVLLDLQNSNSKYSFDLNVDKIEQGICYHFVYLWLASTLKTVLQSECPKPGNYEWFYGVLEKLMNWGDQDPIATLEDTKPKNISINDVKLFIDYIFGFYHYQGQAIDYKSIIEQANDQVQTSEKQSLEARREVTKQNISLMVKKEHLEQLITTMLKPGEFTSITVGNHCFGVYYLPNATDGKCYLYYNSNDPLDKIFESKQYINPVTASDIADQVIEASYSMSAWSTQSYFIGNFLPINFEYYGQFSLEHQKQIKQFRRDEFLKFAEEKPSVSLSFQFLMNASEDLGFFESCLSVHNDINIKDFNGNSLAFLAVGRKNKELLKLLIEKNIDLCRKNKQEETVYHLAVILPDNDEVLDILLASDVKSVISLKDKNGQSPLHKAIISGQLKNVERLLCLGANPNDSDNNRASPLMLATLQDNTEMLNLLVKHGASLNHTEADGLTAHDLAFVMGKKNAQAFLSEKNAKFSPLLRAVYENNLEEAQKVKEDSSSNILKICLMYAHNTMNRPLIEILVKAGADIFSILELSIQREQFDLVEYLIDYHYINMRKSETFAKIIFLKRTKPWDKPLEGEGLPPPPSQVTKSKREWEMSSDDDEPNEKGKLTDELQARLDMAENHGMYEKSIPNAPDRGVSKAIKAYLKLLPGTKKSRIKHLTAVTDVGLCGRYVPVWLACSLISLQNRDKEDTQDLNDIYWFYKCMAKLTNWDMQSLESLKDTKPVDITTQDLDVFLDSVYAVDQPWQAHDFETNKIFHNIASPSKLSLPNQENSFSNFQKVPLIIERDKLAEVIAEIMQPGCAARISMGNHEYGIYCLPDVAAPYNLVYFNSNDSVYYDIKEGNIHERMSASQIATCMLQSNYRFYFGKHDKYFDKGLISVTFDLFNYHDSSLISDNDKSAVLAKYFIKPRDIGTLYSKLSIMLMDSGLFNFFVSSNYLPSDYQDQSKPISTFEDMQVLMYAILSNNFLAFQKMLKKLSDLDAPANFMGLTLVNYAVRSKDPWFLLLLLKNGASLKKAAKRENLLASAVQFGAALEIIKFLVSNGYDVNSVDSYGNSVLSYAIGGDPANLDYLLSLKPSLEKKDKRGNTPLMIAARSIKGPMSTMKLVQAGAKPLVSVGYSPRVDIPAVTIFNTLKQTLFDFFGTSFRLKLSSTQPTSSPVSILLYFIDKCLRMVAVGNNQESSVKQPLRLTSRAHEDVKLLKYDVVPSLDSAKRASVALDR